MHYGLWFLRAQLFEGQLEQIFSVLLKSIFLDTFLLSF